MDSDLVGAGGWWHGLSRVHQRALTLSLIVFWIPLTLVLVLHGMQWLTNRFIFASWPYIGMALMTLGFSALVFLYGAAMIVGAVKFVFDETKQKKTT